MPPARPQLRALVQSRHAGALGFTVAALGVFLLYFLGMNQGIPTWWSDSYEYAVTARNLVQGRGLVNTIPNVLDVWVLNKFPPPLPYVHHDSGLPLLMGLVMFGLGAESESVAWTGGIFYILTVPLTFYFGWKLYNKYVGLLAALLALINVQLIAYSTSGLSEVPYAFFMTLFFFALYRQRTRLDLVLTGVLFGWLWILRSNTLSTLPWVLVFVLVAPAANQTAFVPVREWLRSLWLARGGVLSRLAFFLLGALALLTPQMLRNLQTVGSPFYTVASMYSLVFYTNAFEGKNSEFLSNEGLDLNPVQYLISNPDQLWSKINYQVPQQLEYLWNGGLQEPTYVDAILIVLFLAGAVLPRPAETPRRRLFRVMLYLCIATAILVGAMTNLRWRHLYGFMPVALIFIAEFILQLTNLKTTRLAFLRNPFIIIAVVLMTLVVPSFLAIQATARTGHTLDRHYRQIARWLRQQTPDNTLVLMDRGESAFGSQYALAWYSRLDIAEFSPYTANYFRQYVSQPYVLFIMSKPQDQENALILGGFPNHQRTAERPSEIGLDATLYAPSQ